MPGYNYNQSNDAAVSEPADIQKGQKLTKMLEKKVSKVDNASNFYVLLCNNGVFSRVS